MSLKLLCIDEDLLQVENTAFYFGQTGEMLNKGKKGHAICSSIKAIQEKVAAKPTFLHFDTQIVGSVTQNVFDRVLDIYEANQATCEEFMSGMKEDELRTYLSALESWFVLIIEPRPNNRLDWPAWQHREMTKFLEGVSTYCLPKLRSLISVDESTNAKVQRQINWDQIKIN